MKPTPHIGAPPGPNGSPSAALSPAHGNPVARRCAVRSTAVRRTWVLGPLVLAVPLSLVLALAGAAADGIGALWLAAVLWAIAASFVQALRQGVRHGDRSAFTSCDLLRNDDNFDFETRSGEFVFMQIQADDEALMRDGDRFLKDRDHDDSRP